MPISLLPTGRTNHAPHHQVTHPGAALAAFALGARAEEYQIGTTSVGGAFSSMDQRISDPVNKHADGHITMVPIVTQGTVQNPRVVDRGEVELGITNATLVADAVACRERAAPPDRKD